MVLTHQGRIRVIAILCVLVVLVVIGRLYFVQVVHGDAFSKKATGQYVQTSGHIYDRGEIIFTTKEGQPFAGATIRSGFAAAIHPERITDASALFNKLTPLLDLEKEEFMRKAQKKGDPHEQIATRLGSTTSAKISELDEPGVSTYREQWRYYPGDTLAAHTVGFVGFEENSLVGRYGLERTYEKTLQRDTKSLYVNFFAEIFANIHSTLFESSENRSGNVITHIEPSVQLFLEDVVAETQKEWNSHRTAAIVIDPRTGAIHAMAARPTFNPNTFSSVSNIGVYVNPLVEHVYEFGSIVKALTMAAGLDSGAVTPETEYTDRGSVTYNGETIKNYDGKARGTVDMQTVINQSLNTGAAHVVDEMGTEAFANYMRAFGLDEKTDIDLPNEAEGLIENLNSDRMLEYATASFGQGVAVSPVAMTRALSVLANDGKLVTPHVAREIDYVHGFSEDLKPEEGERVISKESAEAITRMLVTAVDEELAGGDAEREHYSIAAKTGTAQMAGPNGGYVEGEYLHSFFGYFPAYDPQFLVFFMTVKPHGARYASQTLTEPFMDVADYLISYYDIPPDR